MAQPMFVTLCQRWSSARSRRNLCRLVSTEWTKQHFSEHHQSSGSTNDSISMASLHTGWNPIRRSIIVEWNDRQHYLFSSFADPIWLVASVEEGGLMGITQQMEQCHSLGMNPIHPHLHYSQLMSNPVSPRFQSSSMNPFQATRCNRMCSHRMCLKSFLFI